MNSQVVIKDVAVSFKKSCISSILCRPDCRKARINPDVGALRRLVRDPKCRPVLRGIFESLLNYLLQDLLERTNDHTRMEMRESGTLFKIHARNTDKLDLQREKKAPKGLQVVQLSEKKAADPKTSKKCKTDQRGDLPSRRLTTFQLLQSKFLRSSPKPYNTNQREVGTLSFTRGRPGRDNPNNDRKHSTDIRDKGLKRCGSVKEMVAKFAMAEQKQQGVKTLKKEPLKPRHIGRGILLNSLMTKFENIATVCKKSDFALSHEKPGVGDRVAPKVKEEAVIKRKKQQVSDPVFNKQSRWKRNECKYTADDSTSNQIRSEEPESPDPGADILAKGNSNTEDESHMKAETLDQEVFYSLQLMKGQAHNVDVEDKGLQQVGRIPFTVNKAESLKKRVMFADLETTTLMSVTKWSFPRPCKVLIQEEIPVKWQIVTIMTRSPAWSTCVDSSPQQLLKKMESEVSESQTQDRMSMETTGNLLDNLNCLSGVSAESESRQMEASATPKTETYSLEYPNEDINLQTPDPIQGGFSKCVIPSIHRSKNRADQIDSTPHPETVTNLTKNQILHSSLIHQENDVSRSTEGIKDKESCSPNSISHSEVTIRTPNGEAEAKHSSVSDGNLPEKNNTGKPGNFSHLDEASNKDPFADSEGSVVDQTQPERQNAKQKPKYKTINYADPTVKQTYKPKIIRFTDTFTF